jgi:hypothetical protein
MTGPTVVALTFASVAHVQGTMNFSGATTLMATFKAFGIYARAVIWFRGTYLAGIPLGIVLNPAISLRPKDGIPPQRTSPLDYAPPLKQSDV